MGAGDVDGGPGPARNADVGPGQCGRVVDAVARHGHHLVLALQCLYQCQLGGGRAGAVVAGDRKVGSDRVAGGQDDAQAAAAQAFQRGAGAACERVRQHCDAMVAATL